MTLYNLARRDEGLPLRREVNRLFDNFFSDFGFDPLMRVAQEPRPVLFAPQINVSETEKAMHITAELPGLDEKDVDVEIDDDVLSISGEKKEEHEEKGKEWHKYERSYGSFKRVIPLTSEIDTAKSTASFKNGVLEIELPKLKEKEAKKKKIKIAAA